MIFPGRILTRRKRKRRMARITISLMLKGFGYFLTKEEEEEEEEEEEAAKSMVGYFFSDGVVSEAGGGLTCCRRVSREGEGAKEGLDNYFFGEIIPVGDGGGGRLGGEPEGG